MDWNRAKNIFYNLTDLQIAWINEASKMDEERLSKERDKQSSFGNVNEEKKSFNLRG